MYYPDKKPAPRSYGFIIWVLPWLSSLVHMPSLILALKLLRIGMSTHPTALFNLHEGSLPEYSNILAGSWVLDHRVI